MGTALAIAKGTSGIGSGGGADKASVAAPKALESRAYGRAGGAGVKATAWQGLGWSQWERASKCSLGQKGRDQAGGIDKMGPTERGTRKECDRAKGTHLRRLQREDMSAHRKKRPHKGHSQDGDSRAREGIPNALVWRYWK